MSDNIRPPLYGARYEAFLANRTDAEPGSRVTVLGKHCESGDVLIKDVHLPNDVSPGHLLCIPAMGAYVFDGEQLQPRAEAGSRDGAAPKPIFGRHYVGLRMDSFLDEMTG